MLFLHHISFSFCRLLLFKPPFVNQLEMFPDEMLTGLFPCLQAVRVQDPPHGLPAAAASRLQLQEPCQGHPLEHPGQRRRRKISRERVETGENYHQMGRGVTRILHSFSGGPSPPRRLYFDLDTGKWEDEIFECEREKNVQPWSKSQVNTHTHTHTHTRSYIQETHSCIHTRGIPCT